MTQGTSINKVLMTADTIGGVWTYAIDLCKSLAPYGVEVHLATMGRRLSENQRKEVRKIKNLRIYESNYKLEWMENPWNDVAAAGEWLLELESKIDPDVVHLNNYAHGNLPWQSPTVMVAHSCVLSWWEAVKSESVPPEWNLYKRKVADGLQAADVVVGITHTYTHTIRRLYGPFKKELVFYNGCQPTDFKCGKKEEKIFAMGRIWDEAKNLILLDKISEKSPFPITIAGDQSDPSNHKKVELKRVTLTGHLCKEEVKTFLSESLIYVLPAKYEPFGLSALEAALSGCLLVIADIPTLREIWSDAALYFNPSNPDSLLHQLQWVYEYPEKREALVNKSRQRALFFSLEKMSKNYLNLYKSLTASVEKGAIF